MSRHAAPRDARSRRRAAPVAVGGVVAAVGLAVTGLGVFAGLNAVATNTTPQPVDSGTLSLTMANATGSAGFTSPIATMAPGDRVNRYVDLTTGGTLDGQALTLGVVDTTATPTKLSTSATNGLHVYVVQCVGGTWAVSTGVCSGTTSTLASNVALSSLSTPASLVSGAVAKGTTLHLQVGVALPDQNETTTNGALPTGTIQGLTANLTWTFSVAQRTATTTDA